MKISKKNIKKELLKISFIKETNKKKLKSNPKLIYNNLVVCLAYIDYKNLNKDYKEYVKIIDTEIRKLLKKQ